MPRCPNATWSPFIILGWHGNYGALFELDEHASRLDTLSIDGVAVCFLS